MNNQLTDTLFALGYTKEYHPANVEWSSGWREFEYTWKYLVSNTVWESPCGLLKNGLDSTGWSSYLGVKYRPENDNILCGCPYFDEKPCIYRLDKRMAGENCIFHQTNKPYSYDNSVEKLWRQWDFIQHEAFLRLVKSFPEGVSYCHNYRWNRQKRKYVASYIVKNCIDYRCSNPVCAVTGKARDLKKVNIFYDIKVTEQLEQYEVSINGSITDKHIRIYKDKRVFEKNIYRSDAESWLKGGLFQPPFPYWFERSTPNTQHYSVISRISPEKLPVLERINVEYINVRIETREKKDLLEDLQNAREGIEVVHESDLKKAAKHKKEKGRERRKALKARKWLKVLHDTERSEHMKDVARTVLKKMGVGYTSGAMATAPMPEFEEITLF